MIRLFALLAGLALVASSIPVTATPPASPIPATASFDCARATTSIERAICADPALALADRTMARLFAHVRTSALGIGPSNELAFQRRWLKDRDGCMASNAYRKTCFMTVYHDRNEALAIAAFDTDPAFARETLRRLDPNGAPLIEAVALYSTEPPRSAWNIARLAAKRAQLLGLIKSSATALATDNDQSFGRDILKDSGITSPADALASDKKFASFVQVASAYIPDGPVPRSIPCAAVLRNPTLLGATGPDFGSTLDNFVFATDCAQTMPPLPRFDRLVALVWKHWIDCDGTIRYAFYRSFATSVDEDRIADRTAIIRDAARVRKMQLPVRRGFPPTDVAAAIDELAAYYATYRQAPVLAARASASDRVRRMLGNGLACS